jgi:hypothetical protein
MSPDPWPVVPNPWQGHPILNVLAALLIIIGIGGLAGILYTGTRDLWRDIRDAWRVYRAWQRALVGTDTPPVAWE